MKITKIEVNKKNKERADIYIDNNFFCSLSMEVLLKNHLKIGQDINTSTIEILISQSEEEIALKKAINFISKRQKTKKETFDYLIKKGFNEEISFNVIEKLERYKFIDDNQFINNYVKSKSSRNGKNKIKIELLLKGVDKQTIENNLKNFKDDKSNIDILIEKYLKNKNLDLKTKEKAFRYLVGRGFDFDDINSCLNKFFKGNFYEDRD